MIKQYPQASTVRWIRFYCSFPSVTCRANQIAFFCSFRKYITNCYLITYFTNNPFVYLVRICCFSYLKSPVSTDQISEGWAKLAQFNICWNNAEQDYPRKTGLSYWYRIFYYWWRKVFIDNKLFCSINIDSSTVLLLKHDTHFKTLFKLMP